MSVFEFPKPTICDFRIAILIPPVSPLEKGDGGTKNVSTQKAIILVGF